MKTTQLLCLSALILVSLGTGTSQAGGYIETWLNVDSCSWVSYWPKDKISMDLKLRPQRLDARYLSAHEKDLNYWRLDTQMSSVYICHAPRQVMGGGFLELNYMQIYNDVGGAYLSNQLTDCSDHLLLSGPSSQVNSGLQYYPPHGIKAFTVWPGTNAYTLTATAYWNAGYSNTYATLTISTSPE